MCKQIRLGPTTKALNYYENRAHDMSRALARCRHKVFRIISSIELEARRAGLKAFSGFAQRASEESAVQQVIDF
jgi:hypothetical protein